MDRKIKRHWVTLVISSFILWSFVAPFWVVNAFAKDKAVLQDATKDELRENQDRETAEAKSSEESKEKTPYGFEKGKKKGWGDEKVPPGWKKGKKTGWHRSEGEVGMPPGLAKKAGGSKGRH